MPAITPRFPAAFRPPAFACWASCPAGEFRSPHGRPTRQRLDPGRVSTFRTSESRPDWVPSLPRGHAVLSRPVRSLRPPLAPSSRGQALSPPAFIPSPGAIYYEASSRVHSRSPARPSPSPVIPGWNGDFLGLLPGLRTPAGRTCGARQGGGRASSTHPELHDRHNRTSNPRAHSQCATSCRTTGIDMTRFPTAGHLASWAKLSPRAPSSPGPRTGPARATSISRTSSARLPPRPPAPTPPGERYRRIVRRRGKLKAHHADHLSACSPHRPPATASSAPATTPGAPTKTSPQPHPATGRTRVHRHPCPAA